MNFNKNVLNVLIPTSNRTSKTIQMIPREVSPILASFTCILKLLRLSKKLVDLKFKPRKFFISVIKIVIATAVPNAEDTGIEINSTTKPANKS